MIGRAFAYYALYRALTGRPLKGKPRITVDYMLTSSWNTMLDELMLHFLEHYVHTPMPLVAGGSVLYDDEYRATP